MPRIILCTNEQILKNSIQDFEFNPTTDADPKHTALKG
jgi:hypothetical protein